MIIARKDVEVYDTTDTKWTVHNLDWLSVLSSWMIQDVYARKCCLCGNVVNLLDVSRWWWKTAFLYQKHDDMFSNFVIGDGHSIMVFHSLEPPWKLFPPRIVASCLLSLLLNHRTSQVSTTSRPLKSCLVPRLPVFKHQVPYYVAWHLGWKRNGCWYAHRNRGRSSNDRRWSRII